MYDICVTNDLHEHGCSRVCMCMCVCVCVCVHVAMNGVS